MLPSLVEQDVGLDEVNSTKRFEIEQSTIAGSSGSEHLVKTIMIAKARTDLAIVNGFIILWVTEVTFLEDECFQIKKYSRKDSLNKLSICMKSIKSIKKIFYDFLDAFSFLNQSLQLGFCPNLQSF
jgi:hypothetical protein